MKTPTILIFILFSFFACSKKKDPTPVTKDKVVVEEEVPDEEEEDEIIDSTRYIIKEKGCNNNVQTYGGCYNSLALINDTAWVKHSDMVQVLDFHYSESGDTLKIFEFETGYQFYKFLVLHPDTLKMLPSNDLWIKRRK